MVVFLRSSNFYLEYYPEMIKIVADALSRRPDFEPDAQTNNWNFAVAMVHSSIPSITLFEVV